MAKKQPEHIQRMVKALKFYADIHHYKTRSSNNSDQFNNAGYRCRALDDAGYKARMALRIYNDTMNAKGGARGKNTKSTNGDTEDS